MLINCKQQDSVLNQSWIQNFGLGRDCLELDGLRSEFKANFWNDSVLEENLLEGKNLEKNGLNQYLLKKRVSEENVLGESVRDSRTMSKENASEHWEAMSSGF